MHVGIDSTSLIYGRGVSRYTANLIRALLTYTDVQLSLYGSSLRQKDVLTKELKSVISSAKPLKKNPKIVIQRFPPTVQNILWNTLRLNPIKGVLPGIEVFHSWDWLQPPDTDLPLVSTVHDLAILRYPETAHPHILKMHEQSWKVLKEKEAHVIAISRATRNDLIELLSYPPHLIHVIHEALPLEIKAVAENMSEETHDRLKAKLQLTKPFVLFVGTREPRKNLLRLIKAWQPFAKDYELIIAGESGWDETSQEGKLFHENLRFLGRVSDQELSVLYGEATVFAYPCLYEGFGLPILEAFYYGTPVLTSNVSSMIEVAGNAAELVNPQSIESISEGLRSLLNESLPDQQRRLQRMIIRLQMFDWQKVARETLSVYQTAITQHQARKSHA